jgi:PadR family transcriptional regulator AphA
MSLKYVILSALSEQSLSGYEISKEFDLVLGNFWHAKHQQVYRELAKMADEGLVSFRLESQTDKPDRKVYSVTEVGAEALQRWFSEPTPMAAIKSALLVKVYACPDPDTLLSQIERFRTERTAALEALRLIADQHYPEPVAEMEDWKKRAYLTLRYGVLQREAQLAWAEEAAEVLRGIKADQASDEG